MADFEGVDYYALDGLLSDEQKLVRDTVREFVNDKILPVIDEHQREGTFPVEALPGMAAMGLLGANLEGYGLPGLDNISYGLGPSAAVALRSNSSIKNSWLISLPFELTNLKDDSITWHRDDALTILSDTFK